MVKGWSRGRGGCGYGSRQGENQYDQRHIYEKQMTNRFGVQCYYRKLFGM